MMALKKQDFERSLAMAGSGFCLYGERLELAKRARKSSDYDMANNEEITAHLKMIGKRIVDLEGFVLSVANTQAQQYKLFASRVKDFTPEEDALLRSAAQQCLDGVQRLTLLHKQFAGEIDDFSKA